jgi:hypothetical protein
MTRDTLHLAQEPRAWVLTRGAEAGIDARPGAHGPLNLQFPMAKALLLVPPSRGGLQNYE